RDAGPCPLRRVRCYFFSSRRRHTRSKRDWSSDVCSSDLKKWLKHTVCFQLTMELLIKHLYQLERKVKLLFQKESLIFWNINYLKKKTGMFLRTLVNRALHQTPIHPLQKQHIYFQQPIILKKT